MKCWHEFSLSRVTVTLFICRDKLLSSFFLMSFLSLTSKFNSRQFWQGCEWTSVSEWFQRDPIECITAGSVCSYICGWLASDIQTFCGQQKKNTINNSGSCQICSYILLHTYVADPLTHTHTPTVHKHTHGYRARVSSCAISHHLVPLLTVFA